MHIRQSKSLFFIIIIIFLWRNVEKKGKNAGKVFGCICCVGNDNLKCKCIYVVINFDFSDLYLQGFFLSFFLFSFPIWLFPILLHLPLKRRFLESWVRTISAINGECSTLVETAEPTWFSRAWITVYVHRSVRITHIQLWMKTELHFCVL